MEVLPSGTACILLLHQGNQSSRSFLIQVSDGISKLHCSYSKWRGKILVIIKIHTTLFQIYPYFAYSCLIATIPIFLFTDIFLYKPTMYLEVLGQVIYRFALVFKDDVLSQQIGHALWGISTASDIGCYSYIYGIFNKDQYKK